MTKEKALEKLVEVERQLSDLTVARDELRAIVLDVNGYNPDRKGPKRGPTFHSIIKLLRKHEKLTSGRLIELLPDVSKKTIFNLMYNLHRQKIVKKDGPNYQLIKGK
jgi:hypothetical protein